MTIALTNAARAAIKKALRGKVQGLDSMTKADLLAAAASHGIDVADIIANTPDDKPAQVTDVIPEMIEQTGAVIQAMQSLTQYNGLSEPRPTQSPRRANAEAKERKAAQLATLLAELAGDTAAPLDEGRVIQLIKEHAPKPGDHVVRHEVTIRNGETSVTIEGAQHPKLATLAKAMGARMTNGFSPNVLLVGPTGSGKTHAAEQVAGAMSRPFYLHGAMSMAHELLGYKDAAGNYHTTPFREAFEKGGVVLLDELDSWDQQVTLALNAALANGVAAFPDGMVKRHADCIVIGAGNTHGTGPTAEYVGRNRLDAAFLSRFPVKIEWPRDPAIERAISANDAWVRRVMKARDRAARAGLKHLIDPRHSQAGAALIAAGMDEDEVASITYLAGLTDDQRRTVEG